MTNPRIFLIFFFALMFTEAIEIFYQDKAWSAAPEEMLQEIAKVSEDNPALAQQMREEFENAIESGQMTAENKMYIGNTPLSENEIATQEGREQIVAMITDEYQKGISGLDQSQYSQVVEVLNAGGGLDDIKTIFAEEIISANYDP